MKIISIKCGGGPITILFNTYGEWVKLNLKRYDWVYISYNHRSKKYSFKLYKKGKERESIDPIQNCTSCDSKLTLMNGILQCPNYDCHLKELDIVAKTAKLFKVRALSSLYNTLHNECTSIELSGVLNINEKTLRDITYFKNINGTHIMNKFISFKKDGIYQYQFLTILNIPYVTKFVAKTIMEYVTIDELLALDEKKLYTVEFVYNDIPIGFELLMGKILAYFKHRKDYIKSLMGCFSFKQLDKNKSFKVYAGSYAHYRYYKEYEFQPVGVTSTYPIKDVPICEDIVPELDKILEYKKNGDTHTFNSYYREFLKKS